MSSALGYTAPLLNIMQTEVQSQLSNIQDGDQAAWNHIFEQVCSLTAAIGLHGVRRIADD